MRIVALTVSIAVLVFAVLGVSNNSCSSLTASSCHATDYSLDNSRTSMIFGVSDFGCSFTYGRFNTLTAGFSFDKEKPTAADFQFEIDTSSIDTNDAKRDEHARP